MRKHLDKIPDGTQGAELVKHLNKIIDNLNTMLGELDEENFAQNIVDKLKGE